MYGPGIWDDLDQIKNKPTSKFYIKLKRCQNKTTTEEKCSTPEEIDDWLEGKLFDIGWLNYRVSLQPPYSFAMK